MAKSADVFAVSGDVALQRLEAPPESRVKAGEAIGEAIYWRAEVLLTIGKWCRPDGRVVATITVSRRRCGRCGDEARAGLGAVVHSPGGEGEKLEEGRDGVEHEVVALPHR